MWGFSLIEPVLIGTSQKVENLHQFIAHVIMKSNDWWIYTQFIQIYGHWSNWTWKTIKEAQASSNVLGSYYVFRVEYLWKIYRTGKKHAQNSPLNEVGGNIIEKDFTYKIHEWRRLPIILPPTFIPWARIPSTKCLKFGFRLCGFTQNIFCSGH